jgi:hypothetical protein
LKRKQDRFPGCTEIAYFLEAASKINLFEVVFTRTSTQSKERRHMKIDGTEGRFQIPDAKKSTDRPENMDDGFQKIFQQTLKSDPSQAAAPSATTFVHPTAPVAKTDAIVADRMQPVGRVEQLVDRLDAYRRHLADPATNLKTLESMVKKLERERDLLAPVGDELPEGDALRAIAKQSLVAASVEIFKFHRGDYLGT